MVIPTSRGEIILLCMSYVVRKKVIYYNIYFDKNCLSNASIKQVLRDRMHMSERV